MNKNKKCKRCGACCRHLTFNMEGLNTDNRKWLEFHKKCFVFKDKIIVLIPCKHLKRKNDKYICDIFGKPERPDMCAAAGCLKRDTTEGKEELAFIEKKRNELKYD